MREINDICLRKFKGNDSEPLRSIDKVRSVLNDKVKEQDFTTEWLNEQIPSGFPPVSTIFFK